VLCTAFLIGALIRGRRLSVRASWVLCAGLTFAFLLELTQGIVPAWSRQRSPLAGVHGVVKKQRMGVICAGDDWGSIAFQLDYDEHFLHHKDGGEAGALNFLARHP